MARHRNIRNRRSGRRSRKATTISRPPISSPRWTSANITTCSTPSRRREIDQAAGVQCQRGKCPAYRLDPAVADAVLDHRRQEQYQMAKYIAEGVSLAPPHVGDGGMNPVFASQLGTQDAYDNNGQLIKVATAPGALPRTSFQAAPASTVVMPASATTGSRILQPAACGAGERADAAAGAASRRKAKPRPSSRNRSPASSATCSPARRRKPSPLRRSNLRRSPRAAAIPVLRQSQSTAPLCKPLPCRMSQRQRSRWRWRSVRQRQSRNAPSRRKYGPPIRRRQASNNGLLIGRAAGGSSRLVRQPLDRAALNRTLGTPRTTHGLLRLRSRNAQQEAPPDLCRLDQRHCAPT